MADKPLLVLIDGHSVIHRAWHAIKEPLVVRRTGEVVTAVYGFANTLLKVIDELQPTHMALAMDKGVPFRKQQDATYKAQRVAASDELRAQIRRCRQVMEAFRIPMYEHEGYEGDDILGALARQAQALGIETYLVTLDSDIAQLVGPGVRLYMYRPYQRDAVIYDSEERIRERYGLLPKQLPDLRGLSGDVSDNIPGVPGIGDKTAVKLLQQFGDIEGLYRDLERVQPEKLKETLRSHADRVRQSKALATIVTDVPVSLDLEACRLASYDRAAVIDLFRELEFRSLVPRLPQYEEAPEPPQLAREGHPTAWELWPGRVGQEQEGRGPGRLGDQGEPAYHLVRTREELQALARRLRDAREFVFDVEATDINAMRALPVGIAFSVAPGEAHYVPVGHASARQLSLSEVIEVLGPLFGDPGIAKIAHNGKYDILVLSQQGLWTENLAFDTLVAAYLLGESGGGDGGRPGEGALNLKWLVSKRLG
ncbi:MAG TPA: 5'-3' exonuclease H3TH domain-containing protein, partial [Dehalococcoidia bacterium]|nr:5'-3' exonuclease H3TH domain-containing protein [Dehalococcoidia bacterium]